MKLNQMYLNVKAKSKGREIVKNSRLTDEMKKMRKGKTQEQLASEINVSRELISKYENGHTKMNPDVSRSMMKRSENPWFAMALRNEYTGTGSIKLNGPNADLHRSSVKEKAMEEIEELVSILRTLSFSKPLRNASNWERPEIEKLVEEAIEAQTAIDHLIAIVCEEADISYFEAYQSHYLQLQAKGFVEA